MFILNPDPYSLPTYRIGPFTTRYVGINHRLPAGDGFTAYLDKRFAGRPYRITTNGRAAMYAALSHYQLLPDDTVTILTTTVEDGQTLTRKATLVSAEVVTETLADEPIEATPVIEGSKMDPTEEIGRAHV